MFLLMKLPYADNALEPIISAKTISFHYGKHHAGYIKNTNNLIAGTPFEKKGLVEIVRTTATDAAQAGLFNNAAQAMNHDFFWNSLSPKATKPSAGLMKAINADFGSLDALKEQLKKSATALFGSGWTWLVEEGGHLKIVNTSNAGTPFANPKQKPLVCIDVWEHAYYLDYQNLRPDFVQGILDKLINWDFASLNFAGKV